MRFLKDRRGQGALEYALILGIVLAVIVIGMKTGVFNTAVSSVSTFLSQRITRAVK